MFTCILCRFQMEADDAAVGGLGGTCICLRCYVRQVGTERPMPAALRRELTATLAAIEAA
jgi:hypothetical protein